MLDSLAADYAQGDRLAVLFAAEVPIESIFDVALMASKVGYFGDTLKLFVPDSKREGMHELFLGKNSVAFSTDPQALAEQFRPSRNSQSPLRRPFRPLTLRPRAA